MEKDFNYKINNKIYTQQHMVLGQLNQILKIIAGVALPAVINPQSVIASLGLEIPMLLAIVLCEKGHELKDKNIKELTTEITDHVTLDMAVEITEDFFSCNQVVSHWKKIEALIPKKEVEKVPTGSDKSSCCSQEEISPEEMTSSGDTPSKSASHI